MMKRLSMKTIILMSTILLSLPSFASFPVYKQVMGELVLVQNSVIHDAAEELRNKYGVDISSVLSRGVINESGEHGSAYIDPETWIIYLSSSYFNKSIRATLDYTQYIDSGVEALLHESIHIWHLENEEKVEKLLHGPNSYYDKAERSESICTDYIAYTGGGKGKYDLCNGYTTEEIIDALIFSIAWPRRDGRGTGRIEFYSWGEETEETCNFMDWVIVNIDNKKWCHTKKDDFTGYWAGDFHSVDNQYEYFAILMQSFIFNPSYFENIASKNEAEFAINFFKEAYDFQSLDN